MDLYISTEYNRHTGLGNKLFPWARAKVLAETHQIPMLKQIWFSPRGASVIRGGINYLNTLGKIFLINNFNNALNEVSKKKVSRNTSKIYYSNLEDAENKIDQIKTNSIISFKWNTEHNFKDLLPHKYIIKESLYSIIKTKILIQFSRKYNYEYVAINYRAGNDFLENDSSKIGYKKTSISWFITQMNQLLIEKPNTHFVIVSEGNKKQLAPFLEIKNTHIAKTNTAIEDLLILSNAKLLYVSGNSTFSAWASFLGGMPTIYNQSTSFANFGLPNAKFE